DEGRLLLDGTQHARYHRLARCHAERAAHEAEILRRSDDLLTVQGAFANQDGIIELSFRLRVLQAVRIATAVPEFQRIKRNTGNRILRVLTAVEKMLQACIRTHAEMVVGARHDELVGLEVLVEDHLAAFRAFHPEIVRDLALRGQEAADLRTHDVINPVHARALLTLRYPTKTSSLTSSSSCYSPPR